VTYCYVKQTTTNGIDSTCLIAFFCFGFLTFFFLQDGYGEKDYQNQNLKPVKEVIESVLTTGSIAQINR
ncbi:MAG: hypothetical protein ACLTKE_11135, partial [Coprococcus sp.]